MRGIDKGRPGRAGRRGDRHRQRHRHRPGDGAAARRERLSRVRDRAQPRPARGAAGGRRPSGASSSRCSTLDLTDRASIDEAVATVVAAAGGHLRRSSTTAASACADAPRTAPRRRSGSCSRPTCSARSRSRKAVIPHMREAGCGRIVTVSSVGGRVCGFGVTMYCATKFAQEGLGEGLAQELAPFGIQSVIVEPGIIKTTRWSRHRGTAARAHDPSSPYHELFWASEAIADRIVERSPTRPEHVAARDRGGADGRAAADALRRRARRLGRDRAAALPAAEPVRAPVLRRAHPPAGAPDEGRAASAPAAETAP